MVNLVTAFENTVSAINYVGDNTKKLGVVFLIGGLFGAFLHRKSSNGKTAVTLALMVIIGLALIWQ